MPNEPDDFFDRAFSDHEPSENTPVVSDTAEVIDVDIDPLDWAKKVMAVRNKLTLSEAKAKKELDVFSLAIWEYAQKDKFAYIDMLQKATLIIDKAKSRATADIIDVEETKSINERQRLLNRAVKESLGETV